MNMIELVCIDDDAPQLEVAATRCIGENQETR